MSSQSIDDLFKGMATAKIRGQGNRLGVGLYVVETKTVTRKVGEDPSKPGDSFICEFEVVESNNPANPVGSTASFVVKFNSIYAMGNVVEFAIACLGFEVTKETQANADIRQQADIITRAALGSETAAADLATLRSHFGPQWGSMTGKRLKVEATQTPNKKKPGEFYTNLKWSPLKPPTAAPAAA